MAWVFVIDVAEDIKSSELIHYLEAEARIFYDWKPVHLIGEEGGSHPGLIFTGKPKREELDSVKERAFRYAFNHAITITGFRLLEEKPATFVERDIESLTPILKPGVLDFIMEDSDIGRVTLRHYFRELLRTLWRDGERFSGKRPLGNSNWQQDVVDTLVKSGFINGSVTEDGWSEVDWDEADKFVREEIIDKMCSGE